MNTLANSLFARSQSQMAPRSICRPALGTAVLAAIALAAIPAFAATFTDDDVPAASATAANTRALRLSSVEGQVRVVQDGQIVADPALANMPLFSGSEIVTGNDGRTEIQLEDGSVIRLSPNSTLTFPAIEKHGSSAHTEVALVSGLAYFELEPSTGDDSLRVTYGGASFAATSFSVVRVTMDTPPGELAVFSGNVHLDRGDALQLDIHGGESLNLDTTDPARYTLHESIQPDSWDTWNADRDQLLNAEASQQTAASSGYGTSVAGMADLDANGNWYNVPGQGYLWSPYDAQAQGASWDPYGYGHWVFYPGRGWVWVSGYGWGYAAFNCGTWDFYDSFGWGWLPGGGCGGWNFGGEGYGYNIGTYPRGYKPPRRPILPPRQPRQVGSRTLLASNIVPVDRRITGGNQAILSRPNQPATIGGYPVEPLKPLAPRQSYDRQPGAMASGRPSNGYFPTPSRPASAAPPYRASSFGSHPVSAGSSNHVSSYSGGGASHSVPSGGGAGGGGGGHVSSGGGGGGGGSHH